MTRLTSKERLLRQVRGQEVDEVPTIGGWIGGARVLADLAGISPEQYVAAPFRGMLRAHKALGVDAMVTPVYPTALDQVRTGHVTEAEHTGVEPEALLDRANSLPDSEREILKDFDAVAAEKWFRDYFEDALARWEGIVPIPNFWDLCGHFPLYAEYGYVAFLSACALYPEAVHKIWWTKSVISNARSKILARLYREYDLVPLMFCGEDLCNNQGPMVAPEFLRQYYLPTVRLCIEPLLEIGVRCIHHCDGDVRPLVDDFLATGFTGFQGFQYEVGVDPYELRKKRGAHGEEMLFFAGLSVSRTLPFGTPADVREEVDYFLDFTDGGRGLFLFTSNVTGVEVPAENIRVAYRHIKQWNPRQPRQATHRPWPFGELQHEPTN
ncbi:MAG: hypothetical protein WCS70_14625 [Verrucomicrobiota bacterium]